MRRNGHLLLLAPLAALAGCLGQPADGLAPAPAAATTVKMDLLHRPLPDIPLPNDLATRPDPTSATGRRINASMIAPTRFESRIRELIDGLDGWGVFQPITIPFTGPLDVGSILAGHRDPDYDTRNDVVYLINIDRRSPRFGAIQLLDVGEGNFPVTIEDPDLYGKNDPRGWTVSLLFEEADEDLNHNGKLDPGEDSDADGVLDRPNYLPGARPAREDLAGRADALMTFYERETDTLVLRPLLPLDQRTTYAVVVTRRLLDAAGRPVGSPYAQINHASQTKALWLLPEALPPGLSLEDVAFAFSFTTQSISSPMVAVREGLYGHGVQAHLAQAYPPRVAGLEPLRDGQPQKGDNFYILQPERYLPIFRNLAGTLFEIEQDTAFMDETLKIHHYVDYHVIGSFDSPQLMPRTDASGALLPLHDQIWPEDLDRVPAPAHPERIRFWLTVPRKEVCPARARGEPAPLLILAPGYGSSWIEMLFIGTAMAKHGLATICINPPSHGMEFSAVQETLARLIARAEGFESLFNALLKHRAVDQNGDGVTDNGADFLTAYMFHTRDMLRQGALDYMQLVRLLRSFDGKRRWAHDVNGDGAAELAGDFDADGVVDVGGTAPITMAGGSMGGMMTMITGSLDPQISVVVPFASGGGLGDVGARSLHEGVPEALVLRMMGPIYTGTLETDGKLSLEVTVPDLNKEAVLPLGSFQGVKVGDLLVAENLKTGERGCGFVGPTGEARAQVASDAGDPTRLALYTGGALAGQDCALRPDARPRATVETFQDQTVFRAKVIKAGTPLCALADGLGLRRASPALRRMLSFGALVVDAADPVAFVRHLQQRPLSYPATGERTGAHILLPMSIGDMDVPVSTGISVGRAAGLIDFLRPDPRFGKSPDRVLIDTHTAEAIHTMKRYAMADGTPAHLDIDNLSQGQDIWGAALPRLKTPLRIGVGETDRLGGASAVIFPYSDPEGIHMVKLPGKMTDDFRKLCKAACTKTPAGPEDDDPCACEAERPFDIGLYFFNVIGRYLKKGGRELSLDVCQGTDACADSAPVPKQRDLSTLP